MAEGVIVSEGRFQREDGVPLGAITDSVFKQPLIFWQHTTGISQTLPNAIWTPIAFNALITTVGLGWSTKADGVIFAPASTTIAAGSDTAVLPQATINVVSTAGFAAASANAPGYLVVRISGTDRVIQYTNLNATQFLGCTFGVGTLATGQPIAQANVEWNLPVGTLGPMVAELAWASSAVGLRGTRLKAMNAFSPGVALNAGTDVRPAGVASADPLVRSIASEQPAWTGVTRTSRIEGFQSSGGILDCAVDQLAAPRLVAQALSGI